MLHINYCVPSALFGLETHVSFLKAGNTPHRPHSHNDEELIVILSGQLQILKSTKSKKISRSCPLGPGSIIYHESLNPHTIYCVGPENGVYICIRWNGQKFKKKGDLLNSIEFFPPYFKQKHDLHSEFKTMTIFESPTEFLGKLHCHISNLKSGASYEPHIDYYDVMLILLNGKIMTLKNELESNSIIFYHAGEPHGIRNIGSKLAQYIVFEFHGNEGLLNTRINIRRIFKLVYKRIVPKKIRAFIFKIKRTYTLLL
jgi:mannose-6-phosphate isomerase-like protein (cupin superfamily)